MLYSRRAVKIRSTVDKVQAPKTRVFDLLYRAYHAWPQFYSGVSQLLSVGQWEKWQDSVFTDLSGKRVLEIGVGPGKLLVRMAKKGFEVTGTELRAGMAYEARRRVRDAGYDIDIIQTPPHKLPFKDESVDNIVLTFIMAEIEDLDQAISEWRRILKTGGKVIVVAGGMPQDKNPVAKILFKLVEPHTTLRLERDNAALFSKHKFQVTRVDYGPFNIINKIIALKR